MKLIIKHNFISVVCISFTAIVCAKLLAALVMGVTDKNYTLNIFAILGFSVIIPATLALHYYLQKYPLIPVLIGQYIGVVAVTVASVKITDLIVGTSTEAMWQMIRSVSIPFAVSALIYYISFFRQIRNANELLSVLSDDCSQ